MLEKKIETKLREEVKKQGGKAYKFVSPGNAGVPDRLVVLPDGKIAFVEIKRKGAKPRPLQVNRIKELEKLGCLVVVIDCVEDIAPLLETIRKR